MTLRTSRAPRLLGIGIVVVMVACHPTIVTPGDVGTDVAEASTAFDATTSALDGGGDLVDAAVAPDSTSAAEDVGHVELDAASVADVAPHDAGTCFPADRPDASGPLGPCETSLDCQCGWFCRRGGCGPPGACVELPDSCAMMGPVCGCNGVTYPDMCTAALAPTAITSTFMACRDGG